MHLQGLSGFICKAYLWFYLQGLSLKAYLSARPLWLYLQGLSGFICKTYLCFYLQGLSGFYLQGLSGFICKAYLWLCLKAYLPDWLFPSPAPR